MSFFELFLGALLVGAIIVLWAVNDYKEEKIRKANFHKRMRKHEPPQ
jgi:hypothetical protein